MTSAASEIYIFNIRRFRIFKKLCMLKKNFNCQKWNFYSLRNMSKHIHNKSTTPTMKVTLTMFLTIIRIKKMLTDWLTCYKIQYLTQPEKRYQE